MMKNCKHVFVTGGVTSSLGKGIVSSSLAVLLQSRGFRVTIQKLDPYLNIDPGTLNPYEHGECYVTNDGAETDLDLGHYERFLSVPMSKQNNITTGSVYESIIHKERKGEYLGKTVQVIPHVTDEIKNRIQTLANNEFDILITEIGGTVGDIESLPYIETVRQLKFNKNRDSIVIHLTLVPFLKSTGELKTKPTQHSVKTLLQYGVQPDILVCRSEINIEESVKNKIALFCNVQKKSVIESIDTESIYNVPILLHKQGLDTEVLKKLNIEKYPKPNLRKWNTFLNRLNSPKKEICVAVVGKYVELKDSYKSIFESLIHAGVYLNCKVIVKWVHSNDLENNKITSQFEKCSGIIVAPGFGGRDIIGKLNAIKYSRLNNIPFFGICLGMQMAVVEFARNVLKLNDADSTEMNPTTKNPVIDLMKSQKNISEKGGTMRLGEYKCAILKESKSFSAYRKKNILERHRHRYEFNNSYIKLFEKNGMKCVGLNPKSKLVEIIEIENHPWFVGVQFHPEYKSTVIKPHPLFISFIGASIKNIKNGK